MTDNSDEKLIARVAVLGAKIVFLKNMKSELCIKMSLLKEQTDIRINALKEATQLSDKVNDLKHEQMNEVRSQLNEKHHYSSPKRNILLLCRQLIFKFKMLPAI